MKLLPIVNSHFKVKIDDEDHTTLSQFVWYLKNSSSNMYAKTELSRGIWTYVHQMLIVNVPIGHSIDHKDRDGLNNQKENLRIATYQQQTINSPKRVHKGFGKRSNYKGVYYEYRTNKWFSSITVNRKSISLGTYKEEIHAAKAYNEAALKYFGEFAVINEFNLEDLAKA